MEAHVFRQLGVEGSGQQVLLTHCNNPAFIARLHFGKDFYLRSSTGNERCTDEDRFDIRGNALYVQRGLEAVELSSEGIAADSGIQKTKSGLAE